MKQVKAINPKIKMPVMIPLAGLELEADSNTNHGLAFQPREDAEIIYAPILNKETAKFSSEDIDQKTGLPEKLGNGNRTLYTRQEGLRRLYLDGDLYLDSNVGDLAYSGGNGRVVVVKSGEAASQKFYNFIKKKNQIIAEYVKNLTDLEEQIKTEKSRINTSL